MSDGKPATPPTAGPGAGTPAASPVQHCASCTVTLTPADIKICGAGSTSVITAVGTPAGGTYSFSSSNASRASLSGTGDRGTITAVAQGRAVVKVIYNVSGCPPCEATVNAMHAG